MNYLQQIFVGFVLWESVDHGLDKAVGKGERPVGPSCAWKGREPSVSAHSAVLPPSLW